MKRPSVNLSPAEHQIAQDSADILSDNAVASVLNGATGVRDFGTTGSRNKTDNLNAIHLDMLLMELGGAAEIAAFESVIKFRATDRRVSVPKTIKAGWLRREKVIYEEVIERSGVHEPDLMIDSRNGTETPKATFYYGYNFYNNHFNYEDRRVTGKRSPYYGLRTPQGMLELQGSLPQKLADDLFELTLEKPVAIRAVTQKVGTTILSRIALGSDGERYRTAVLPDYSDLPDGGPGSEFPEWSLFLAHTKAVPQEDGNYKQKTVWKPAQGMIVPVGSSSPVDMVPALH